MARKRFSTEQIIRKLREAEVELAKGLNREAVCKKLGFTSNTYYRWRKEQGGLRIDQAKRLLDYRLEHASEEYRESMLKNVRLHREIVEASEEHGGEIGPEGDE